MIARTNSLVRRVWRGGGAVGPSPGLTVRKWFESRFRFHVAAAKPIRARKGRGVETAQQKVRRGGAAAPACSSFRPDPRPSRRRFGT